MPPAYRSTAQQYANLKALVGRSNETSLIPDGLLDAATSDALLQVNQQMPLVGVSSFQTVVDQQSYTVALPAGSYGIRAVYWPNAVDSGSGGQSACCNQMGAAVVSLRALDELGNYTIDEPSLQMAIQRNTVLRAAYAASGAVVQQPNIVRLHPVPTAVVTVYYTYSAPRYATIEDVSPVDFALYWAFARYRLNEALSTGQGALTSVESEQGIKVTNRASQAHAEAAKRALQEYYDRLPLHVPFRANL
jgi:hypothetical protein